MIECKRCSTELTKDEDRNCLYCSQCHPLQKKSMPLQEIEKNYVDVKPTEKRTAEIIKIIKNVVPDLIREELENWHIKKPVVDKVVVDEPVIEVNPNEHKDWKVEAKELNIETYDKVNNRPRKKIDVLADIQKKKASN